VIDPKTRTALYLWANPISFWLLFALIFWTYKAIDTSYEIDVVRAECQSSIKK
jgi:hypothetical protein